jgi:dolichol-phosphate mannosyltransferase
LASNVLVFTATYNEVGSISVWYELVRKAQPSCQILVVDDNSQDGTLEKLKDISNIDPNFCYIVRQKKLGLGSAHKYALIYAISQDFSVLVTMDADLSHDPAEIPNLLEELKNSDFVVGTRWSGGTCDYTGIRKILSILANQFARLLIPTGLSEYTTSYRAFSLLAMHSLSQNLPPDDNYAFFLEQIDSLYNQGLRLSEVPIHFRDRTVGKSKIPRNQILVSASVLLNLGIKRRYKSKI